MAALKTPPPSAKPGPACVARSRRARRHSRLQGARSRRPLTGLARPPSLRSAATSYNSELSLDGVKPFRRLTFDDLAGAGFANETDFEALDVPLCRAAGRFFSPGSRAWPLVAPSPEIYGAVAGWVVGEGGGGGAPPAAAAAAAAAADGEGEGAPAGAAAGAPAPLRDRNVYEPYRWQQSPLHERAEALEERTAELAAALRAGGVGFSPGMSVGRIVPEAEAAKINRASVALELASVAAGGTGGGRLTLDLREAPGAWAVFPGQTVGVKGVSVREGVVQVTELATRAPPPPVRAPRANAAVLAGLRAGSGPLRAFVAAGPYTAPGDLAYDALQALLAEVACVGADDSARAPDVLVLMGPFVDAENELVRSGRTVLGGDALTFDEVFSVAFLTILNEYLQQESSMGVHVVLIPSTADVTTQPVYPQWPLPATALHCDEVSPSVRDRITLLPNPASFVVGDVLWGATTADPAFALNTEEAAAPSAERGDRFAALARHCLDQRSFYPVFPPPLPPTNKAPGAAAETDQAARALPLEVTRVWHAGLPACPDVLLLPSRLGNPQARALGEHTVLVNPGALATRKTFARVAVFPDVPPPPGAPPFVTLRAQARVRVDIDKIA